MKNLLLLCIIGQALTIHASVLAGPYQVIFFWYAYQLEIQALGVSSEERIIATGCGAETGKNCSFDEFIRWVQRKNKKSVPWHADKTSGVGTNLTPDPHTTADALVAAGYVANDDAHALLPSIFPGPDSKGFKYLWGPIMERVKVSRLALKLANKDISTEIDMMKKALHSISNWRTVDQNAAQIEDFKAWRKAQYQNIIFDTYTKPITNDDGTTYDVLDTDRMVKELDQKPDVKAELKVFVRDFATLYSKGEDPRPNNSGKSRASAHFSVIEFCKQAFNTLSEDVKC